MRKFRVKLKKGTKKKGVEKNSKPFSYKRALFVFMPLFIVIILFVSFYVLYMKSPHFNVHDVVTIGRGPSTTVNYTDLQQLMVGKNIFKLDLKEVRDYMLNSYGELLDLKLKRAFPSSIIVTIILRKPVAQLHQELYYPVDDGGIILSGARNYPHEKLPLINGIRFNPSSEVGKETQSQRVKKALLLLKELENCGILKKHTLVEIDVSSIRNVIFFLEDGLEVKIGRDEYAMRLENLKEILYDPKLRPGDIRYIDLRFKEPVIGPKWKR